MASIRIKFRPSKEEGRQGTVYYQITHGRLTRQVSSRIRLSHNEWEQLVSPDSDSGATAGGRQHDYLHGEIKQDMEVFSRIFDGLRKQGVRLTAENVATEFRRYSNECSISAFMNKEIDHLIRAGKIRTAETYEATLRNFMKFTGGEEKMFYQLTQSLAEDYERWNRGRGLTRNTISFYNRILRAVYNRSVDAGLTSDANPFKRCYTGVDKTQKRAIPLTMIKRIKRLCIGTIPALDFARDMFMMSFYLRGMSFVDMAYLKKKDLRHGYVTYRRHKTGQTLMIAWTREMQQIVDKYSTLKSDYLLPILNGTRSDERSRYRNVGYNINRNLKKIGIMVGLKIPLTLYVARHSWASAARAKGIPLSVISEGMGHNSEATTRIYLTSLDTSVVDKANSLILRSL